MSDYLIKAEQVSRTFGKGAAEVHALVDVDVEVHPGELTVVRGPSGSGKTTLLNILGGLDRPSSGKVLLGDGRVLSELKENDVLAVRREMVGHIFQSFGLVPVLSAAENVEVALRLKNTPVSERADRVAKALDKVSLGKHGTQRPYELSGGQQQRVGIARALVSDPQILIADEPTGQLDSDTAATIMDLLSELTHERGIAAVVSTHDPILMERADRLVELHDGHVVNGATAAAVS
ncbi:ABC transporter ATP-binding protein [Ornithinimicrobium faecis]|uniref:ABC transporter ATP-binding protein n=1 Tax=Ornithinimicrobium faecis TaxID=2934158 RepID=A0ABY4YUA8_9MICO|nr:MULTISPECIES: ABC transporter ATP-binding protein [unclassified Ornithinimicrobium]USQ80318.1 ABC transporter ATP-binding protein [Ornithinimicrobium sp. HY1793]